MTGAEEKAEKPLEYKSIPPEAVRALVRDAVRDTLEGLGFDTESPRQLQADMYYLRRLRTGSEEMRRLARRTALSMLISALLYCLWEAFKTLMRNKS